MVEHEKYMELALSLAKEAAAAGETPVGCVIADKNGVIIGEGRNRREQEKNVLAHAELDAISQACRAVNDWRLYGCTLYVTLEPCPMCAGAIINSRLERVFFGARDAISGSCGSVINLFMENYGQHTQITGGILRDECAELLSGFFREVRDKNSNP